jgi:hypothetical protein
MRNVPSGELYLEKELTFFYFNDEIEGDQETNMAHICKSFSPCEQFYVCAIQKKSPSCSEHGRTIVEETVVKNLAVGCAAKVYTRLQRDVFSLVFKITWLCF